MFFVFTNKTQADVTDGGGVTCAVCPRVLLFFTFAPFSNGLARCLSLSVCETAREVSLGFPGLRCAGCA